MHQVYHAHLSVQQTQCGSPGAPVAFLPASHLDSPEEETFVYNKFLINKKSCSLLPQSNNQKNFNQVEPAQSQEIRHHYI